MQFFFNFCDQAIILLHTELETQRLEEFTERYQLQNGKTIFKQMQHRTWIHPHFCIESNCVHIIENVYNVLCLKIPRVSWRKNNHFEGHLMMSARVLDCKKRNSLPLYSPLLLSNSVQWWVEFWPFSLVSEVLTLWWDFVLVVVVGWEK